MIDGGHIGSYHEIVNVGELCEGNNCSACYIALEVSDKRCIEDLCELNVFSGHCVYGNCICTAPAVCTESCECFVGFNLVEIVALCAVCGVEDIFALNVLYLVKAFDLDGGADVVSDRCVLDELLDLCGELLELLGIFHKIYGNTEVECEGALACIEICKGLIVEGSEREIDLGICLDNVYGLVDSLYSIVEYKLYLTLTKIELCEKLVVDVLKIYCGEKVSDLCDGELFDESVTEGSDIALIELVVRDVSELCSESLGKLCAVNSGNVKLSELCGCADLCCDGGVVSDNEGSVLGYFSGVVLDGGGVACEYDPEAGLIIFSVDHVLYNEFRCRTVVAHSSELIEGGDSVEHCQLKCCHFKPAVEEYQMLIVYLNGSEVEQELSGLVFGELFCFAEVENSLDVRKGNVLDRILYCVELNKVLEVDSSDESLAVLLHYLINELVNIESAEKLCGRKFADYQFLGEIIDIFYVINDISRLNDLLVKDLVNVVADDADDHIVVDDLVFIKLRIIESMREDGEVRHDHIGDVNFYFIHALDLGYDNGSFVVVYGIDHFFEVNVLKVDIFVSCAARKSLAFCVKSNSYLCCLFGAERVEHVLGSKSCVYKVIGVESFKLSVGDYIVVCKVLEGYVGNKIFVSYKAVIKSDIDLVRVADVTGESVVIAIENTGILDILCVDMSREDIGEYDVGDVRIAVVIDYILLYGIIESCEKTVKLTGSNNTGVLYGLGTYITLVINVFKVDAGVVETRCDRVLFRGCETVSQLFKVGIGDELVYYCVTEVLDNGRSEEGRNINVVINYDLLELIRRNGRAGDHGIEKFVFYEDLYDLLVGDEIVDDLGMRCQILKEYVVVEDLIENVIIFEDLVDYSLIIEHTLEFVVGDDLILRFEKGLENIVIFHKGSTVYLFAFDEILDRAGLKSRCYFSGSERVGVEFIIKKEQDLFLRQESLEVKGIKEGVQLILDEKVIKLIIGDRVNDRLKVKDLKRLVKIDEFEKLFFGEQTEEIIDGKIISEFSESCCIFQIGKQCLYRLYVAVEEQVVDRLGHYGF